MNEKTGKPMSVDTLRLQPRPLPPRIAPPRPKKGEKFVKGPIPWDWITVAGQLPGKAAQIALALWFAAGVHKARTFPVPMNRIRELGVTRQAAYRCLQAMEDAGLISLERGKGKRAMVTLLDL